jgi:SlyX protein
MDLVDSLVVVKKGNEPTEGVRMNDDTQREDSSMGDQSPPLDLAGRLEALESRIAFQEDWLETLDQAIAAQESRLARLERINALIQEKLRDQQRALQENDGAASHPADERPPHY